MTIYNRPDLWPPLTVTTGMSLNDSHCTVSLNAHCSYNNCKTSHANTHKTTHTYTHSIMLPLLFPECQLSLGSFDCIDCNEFSVHTMMNIMILLLLLLLLQPLFFCTLWEGADYDLLFVSIWVITFTASENSIIIIIIIVVVIRMIIPGLMSVS